MAHTNATVLSPIAALCRVGIGRANEHAWLTVVMVRYYAGGWTVQELADIERELDRQGVAYSIDGDDLLVHDDHAERMVDMIVESITET